MYNNVKVDFPNAATNPFRILSFTLWQERYGHEFGVLEFRDWDIGYDEIRPGTPIIVTLIGDSGSKDINGYVHHVEPNFAPGNTSTKVYVIGASYYLKQTSQQVYIKQTASEIVKTIAKRNKFSYEVEDHPRVYSQVSQAGLTDMEMLIKLAKQCGYSLRVSNTEIYFKSVTSLYEETRENAPIFILRDAQNPSGSTLYSFEPQIGESLEHDNEYKAATAIAGVDRFTGKLIKITNPKRPKAIKKKAEPEFFDRFSTLTVANDYDIAMNEAKSVDERTRFPYRAIAEVIGDSYLHPDMPVFLDGIGEPYSGYWIILKTEHKIISKSYNTYVYTTVLTLGADSLGTPTAGKDNKIVEKPATKAKRTITPGVRQTNKKPVSKLKTGTPFVSKTAPTGFGEIKNRTTPKTANQTIIAKKWTNPTGNLKKVSQTSSRPQVVVQKLRGSGVL